VPVFLACSERLENARFPDDFNMTNLDDSIVIVGGGGHSLVVADALATADKPVRGFLDDDPQARLTRRLERLGSLSLLDQPEFIAHHPVILAMGDLAMRGELITRLSGRIATIVHPAAWVSPTATIGVGVFIGPGAVVHTDAMIGDHAIINSAAVVEHDCRVGVNSHIAPNSTLGGDVHIGDHTLVGIGSTVLPGVRIEDHCTVGAGSAVIVDLPAGRVAIGVPAREWIASDA
jgi:acetyltransferase EpsM